MHLNAKSAKDKHPKNYTNLKRQFSYSKETLEKPIIRTVWGPDWHDVFMSALISFTNSSHVALD